MTKLFFTSRGKTITHTTRQNLTLAEATQWGQTALGAAKRGMLFVHWPTTDMYSSVKISRRVRR